MFKFLSIYCHKDIIKVGIYGLMCGMSLLLSGNTVNFWLSTNDIDPKIIGLFSLIALPYVFKFLISIFIERNKVGWLSNKIGNHKAWLLVSQAMISLALLGTSFLTPKQHLFLIALLGTVIAFFSVIQDIILNANRIKILDSSLQPSGNALYTIGYRLGMLFSGAGVILSSVYMSWKVIYFILSASYMLFTISILLFYTESENSKKGQSIPQLDTSSLYSIFIEPLRDLFSSRNFIWIISFILMYKLSDDMLSIMLNPFLLHTEHTPVEIASISKFFWVIMVIVGGIISGPIITKIKIRNSIILFSAVHIFGHLLFILLSITGKNIPLLYFITGYEALTGGMMMTAYLSFISSFCKGKYTAIQYALLSSGMGLSRAIFPVTSGVIVDYYGWVTFFIVVASIASITTIFTFFIPKRLFL